MKKSIIAASAASLALAAMPVVGVFATDAPTVKDIITITLSPTCNITRTGQNSGSASWSGATGVADGTYSLTMDAGTKQTLGTSTLKVTCNDTQNGHALNAAFTGLTADKTAEGNTGLADNATISYTNETTVAGTSGWNATITTANSTLNLTANTIIAGANGSANIYGSTRNKTAVTNSDVVIEYNVATSPVQPAATYTGNATYTLTYGPAA